MLRPRLRSREWLALLAGFSGGFGVTFVYWFSLRIEPSVNCSRENAFDAGSCSETGKTGFALRSAALSPAGSTGGASDLVAEAAITFQDVKKKACHMSNGSQGSGLNKETMDVVCCAASGQCQATQD
jgi:hypothetical protein